MIELPDGGFIPKDLFYQWSAEDLHGRSWASDQVLPEPSVFIPRATSVWHSRLASMTAERARPTPGTEFVLTCVSVVPLDFPANEPTHTTISGPLWPIKSFAHDRARAMPIGIKCDLHTSGAKSTLVATGSAPMRLDLASVLAESLQFVLAAPVIWAVTMCRADVERTTIDSRALVAAKVSRPYRLHRPVPGGAVQTPGDTWQLFERYAEYISTTSGPERHPLAAEFRGVLDGSAASIESQALVTSVAVESVIRQLIAPKAGGTSGELSAVIAALTAVLDTQQCDPSVKKRVTGALDALQHSRAIDVLYDLATQGAVTKEQITAWKKLRNPSSHGTGHLSRRAEVTVRRIDCVTTLLYVLVFYLVGYDGYYTDCCMKPPQTLRYAVTPVAGSSAGIGDGSPPEPGSNASY